MEKNNILVIDDEAMLENFENNYPTNAFEFIEMTKGIKIEYKIA